MSQDKEDDPFDKHRDSQGRVLRRWGHLDVTDEQRASVEKSMEAWRVFSRKPAIRACCWSSAYYRRPRGNEDLGLQGGLGLTKRLGLQQAGTGPSIVGLGRHAGPGLAT